jgi:lysozyme family protein
MEAFPVSLANRKASFLATIAWEGRARLSLDPRDAGNWTGGKVGAGRLVGSKFGVSAMTAARYFPDKAMVDLTVDDALKVFVDGYWTPIRADAIAAGLDHCVSDDAYNAGPASALRRWKRGRFAATADAIGAIHAYATLRLSFLEALRTWKLYKRGWAARVAGVEAESVKMAHAAGSPLPRGLLTPGDHFAAASLAADRSAGSARNIGLAAMATALLAPAVPTHASVALATLVVCAACVAVHQFWTAHVHAARREALGDAADAANEVATAH